MRCKKIIKDIIRNRFRQNHWNAYQIFKNFMNDLALNFDADNEQNAALLKLKENSSKQKLNELFSAFFARLSAIMSQTSFDDEVKISYLRKLINPRLRKQLINITDVRNYRQYVNKVVQIAHNMSEADQEYEQQKPAPKFKSKTFTRNIGREKKSTSLRNKNKKKRKLSRKGLSAEDKSIAKLDKATRKLVMKKSLCVKCFLSEHIATDSKAPCKNDPLTNINQANARLTAVEMILSEHCMHHCEDDSDTCDSDYNSSAISKN